MKMRIFLLYVLYIFTFLSYICTFYTFSLGFISLSLSTWFSNLQLPGNARETFHGLMEEISGWPSLCEDLHGWSELLWVSVYSKHLPPFTDQILYCQHMLHRLQLRILLSEMLLEKLHILDAEGEMYLRWHCSNMFWRTCGVTVTQSGTSQPLVKTRYVSYAFALEIRYSLVPQLTHT